jgi:hypothetical protein
LKLIVPEKSPTFVRRLFRDVLKNVKRKMQTYLRVNIDHPSLDSPVWLEFTQAKNLDEQKILNKIEAVQQSKKEFLLTEGAIELDFVHVKYPEGSGGAKFKHLHLDKKKLRRSEPSSRLTIPGILCVYPVLLLLPVSMLRNLKFLTRSGRRSG